VPSKRIRALVLILALSPLAAAGGTLNVHPSTPAPQTDAPQRQPRATSHREPAAPEIGGRSEVDWREGALARQRALESAEAALAACEVREAPAPYSDYSGYYRPATRPQRRGHQWVEIKNCDDARLDVADARAELDDFEEQARKSAVPPGWMR
jgi:hypothetical protein